jgi:hypothetical protein
MDIRLQPWVVVQNVPCTYFKLLFIVVEVIWKSKWLHLGEGGCTGILSIEVQNERLIEWGVSASFLVSGQILLRTSKYQNFENLIQRL